MRGLNEIIWRLECDHYRDTPKELRDVVKLLIEVSKVLGSLGLE